MGNIFSAGEEKGSWPALVGLPAEGAVETIKRENPLLKIFVLKEGTPVTRDFRRDRIRIWVDEEGKVVRSPQIG